MGSEMGEKFCLRWNDFENSISGAFKDLRDKQDFFDVTIACEDKQIQAHKVILSACSPFFRTILKKNPHQHPLLYLNKVKYDSLVALLNFMYNGEVNVAQDDLSTFLTVAEDLKVKGLTQNDQNQQETQGTQLKRSAETAPTSEKHQKIEKINTDPVNEDEIIEIPSEVKSEPISMVYASDFEEPEQILQEHMGDDYLKGNTDFRQSQNRTNQLTNSRLREMRGNARETGDVDFDEFVNQNTSRVPGSTNIQCHFCSKITLHVGNMKQHFDSNHYHGDYRCDICQQKYKTKKSLIKHQRNLGHVVGEQMMVNDIV